MRPAGSRSLPVKNSVSPGLGPVGGWSTKLPLHTASTTRACVAVFAVARTGFMSILRSGDVLACSRSRSYPVVAAHTSLLPKDAGQSLVGHGAGMTGLPAAIDAARQFWIGSHTAALRASSHTPMP